MSYLRSVLAVAALTLVSVFAVAAPASAHDELVGSSPAADAKLDTLPSEIVLTYPAAIMTDGAAIAVIDADGADLTTGDPVIETNTLTVPIDAAAGSADAGYAVEWRVVSSDGHPISGTIPFTVGDGEPLRDAAAPLADGSSATADSGSNAALALTLTAVGLVLIVGVLAVVLVVARRKSGPRQPK
ncbi:copper resistance protein CopC [Microbacterium marinum]|uniref:copper resistance CopC family protein n=1 Tax=Microbacterium marinum TaxID=421115 RepID=UPI003850932C